MLGEKGCLRRALRTLGICGVELRGRLCMWTNSPEGPCPASACCQGEKKVTWASPFWVLETRLYIYCIHRPTLTGPQHPCSENFYDTLGLLHQYHTFFLAFKFCPGGSSLMTTITLLCNISLSAFHPLIPLLSLRAAGHLLLNSALKLSILHSSSRTITACTDSFCLEIPPTRTAPFLSSLAHLTSLSVLLVYKHSIKQKL